MSNYYVPMEKGQDFSDVQAEINLVKRLIENRYSFNRELYVKFLQDKESEIYKKITGKEDYLELVSKEKVQFWTNYFNSAIGKILNNKEKELSPKECFQLIFSSKNFTNIFNSNDIHVYRHSLLGTLFRGIVDSSNVELKYNDVNKNFTSLTNQEQEIILNKITKIFFSKYNQNEDVDFEILNKKIKIRPDSNYMSGNIYITEGKETKILKYTIETDSNSQKILNMELDENINAKDIKRKIADKLKEDIGINKLIIKINNKEYVIANISGGESYYKNITEQFISRASSSNFGKETTPSCISRNKILTRDGNNTYVSNYLLWFSKAIQDKRYDNKEPEEWYIKQFEKSGLLKGMDPKDKKAKEKIKQMWRQEVIIFNNLKRNFKNTQELGKAIFIDSVKKTFEEIKSRSENQKDILLNFGFYEKKVPLYIVDQAINYFNSYSEKLFKELELTQGVQLITTLYSNTQQLGNVGEMIALFELFGKGFISGGQSHDRSSENVYLGQSFQDIKGVGDNNYGINVKHYLYQGDEIKLYKESISVNAEQYLKYKYLDPKTYEALNFYILNRAFFPEGTDIRKILYQDISKFMRMEWNNEYCLFYRLSNFYYPASIIYKECLNLGLDFFKIEYQSQKSFDNMIEKHIKSDTNYFQSYINEKKSEYSNNKIYYGLGNLKIKEIAGL